MLDIFALAFGLFAIAAFMHGFRKPRPQLWFALAGPCFRSCRSPANGAGCFRSAVCIVIVAVIRLMQGWRTQFADGNADDWYRPDLWPDFRLHAFRRVLRADSGGRLSRDLHSALRIVGSRYHGGATPDFQRQHHDGDRRPYLYELVAVLAVSGAAGLVSVRQDRRRPDCGGRVPRQSAGAVAGAARARGLPARLDRDAPRRRVL